MSSQRNRTRLQRTQLDRKVAKVRPHLGARPPFGWIRAVREALGISAAQLATRVGVSRQTLNEFEQAEKRNTISVGTLKRLAGAMGCEVSITFLPKTTFQAIVEERALGVAQRLVRRTDLHMKLEAQGTDAAYQQDKVRELAEELVRTSDRRLWEEF